MTIPEFEAVCDDYATILTNSEPGTPEHDEILIVTGNIFYQAVQEAIKAGITQDQIKKILKHSFDKLYT